MDANTIKGPVDGAETEMKKTPDVLIQTTAIDREFWLALYHFICRVREGDAPFFETESGAKAFLLGSDWALVSEWGPHCSFSVEYTKLDEKEDFSGLLLYLLLANGLPLVDLCLRINLEKLNKSQQERYIFKYEDFLFFVQHEEAVRKIAFLNVIFIDKVTGVQTVLKERQISWNRSKVILDPSRKYVPVVEVTETNYRDLFDISESEKEHAVNSVCWYIQESSKKISEELNGKGILFSLDHLSLFERWFIQAYLFYNFPTKKDLRGIVVENLLEILKIYSTSISELVQNIIFHTTEKRGLLYAVFCRQSELTDTQQKVLGIANTSMSAETKKRYVEMGVFDFSSIGVEESFKQHSDAGIPIGLLDFYTHIPIPSKEVSRLELRRVAHLGLSIFTATVSRYAGYFRVESNYEKGKKHWLELQGGQFSQVQETAFVNGTHYEILLPVVPADESLTKEVSFLQKGSIVSRLMTGKAVDRSIKRVFLRDFANEPEGLDPSGQLEKIHSIGLQIRSSHPKGRRLVIDLSDTNEKISTIIKLLVSLQSSEAIYYSTIVVYVPSEDRIDAICKLLESRLINADSKVVWNRKTALIIMGPDLRYQIITGSSADEFYAANAEFQHYYYGSRNCFDKKGSPKSTAYRKFILPYELLVEDEGTFPFFSDYMRGLLISPIEKSGYMIDQPTYIGNKMISRRFYEADIIFHNSFYVDRFAYLIASKIVKRLPGEDKAEVKRSQTKKDRKAQKVQGEEQEVPKKVITLVGYRYYSEQLIKKTAKYLQILRDELKPETMVVDEGPDGHLFTAHQVPQDCKHFVTIVPIGATLSTNDKIAAFLKEELGEVGKEVSIDNHCSIVIRDNATGSGELSEMEKSQKWTSIDLSKQIVNTGYVHVQSIQFDLLIGAEDEKKKNWIPRLNKELSFGDTLEKERYVNHSENVSINSQHLLGRPHLNDFFKDKENGYDHTKELTRLMELKPYLRSGHIEYNGLHHRYYVDTESYIRKSGEGFGDWLKEVVVNAKSKGLFDPGKLNVIVTPNPRIESDLASLVNDIAFGGEALTLCLDVKTWRNNVVKKLWYLSDLQHKRDQDVVYYFVDHTISSAATYRRTVSYLRSIESNITFSAAIVIMNRAYGSIYQELRNDFSDGQRLFAYFNLFVPEMMDAQNRCILCSLGDHYEKLKERTVSERCKTIISESIDRAKVKVFPLEVDSNKEESDRRFLRLFFAHEIYYRVAKLREDQPIEDALDPLYKALFLPDGQLHQDSDLDYLNQVFKDPQYLFGKRISFLKALSSPPLSRYIVLRTHAHKLLITVLSDMLKKEDGDYDDFRMMEGVLKSLSFFNSNALVRKDVLLQSWKIRDLTLQNVENELLWYTEVRKQIEKKLADKKDLDIFEAKAKERIDILEHQKNKLVLFGDYLQFYIKNDISQDSSKSLYLGELMRTGKEMALSSIGTDHVAISQTVPMNEMNQAFNAGDRYRFWDDVFFDNTAITRRTLDNFERELKRNGQLKALYYSNPQAKESELELFPFSDFREKIDEASFLFEEIVNDGYYYSDFIPYLNNGDDYRYVLKFCCLLYLRIKFNSVSGFRVSSIEQQLTEFLQGLSYLMDSDYCLYAGGKDNVMYVLDCDSRMPLDGEADFSRGQRFPRESYVNRLFTRENLTQGVIIDTQGLMSSDCELKKRPFKNVCSFVIHVNSLDNDKGQALCFYYKDRGANDQDRLLTQIRESARLLMLLWPEMDRYFNQFLLKERVIDLWIDKIESNYKFNKIYLESAHVFNSVITEMDEFDKLTKEALMKVANTWYWLTNETISHLYSNIEQNIGLDKKNRLELDDDCEILSKSDTIQDVFNEPFIILVSELAKRRWDEKMCSIRINGVDLASFNNKTLPKTQLHCRNHIIQSFVVQCLNNSLGEKSRHGHRHDTEVKQVDILVEDDLIRIIDTTLSGGYNKKDKKERSRKFNNYAQQIRDLDCKHYSSTTLTSIQGFAKFMAEKGAGYQFEFGFDEESDDFSITLRFNSK